MDQSKAHKPMGKEKGSKEKDFRKSLKEPVLWIPLLGLIACYVVKRHIFSFTWLLCIECPLYMPGIISDAKGLSSKENSLKFNSSQGEQTKGLH